MEIIAVSKSVRIAPRKVRLVADAIRKLSLENALIALQNMDKRGSSPLFKTLKSAIANAKNNKKLEQEALRIKMIDIMDAPFYKRFRPSTRGRVHPYKRRGSHIKIVLESISNQPIVSKVEEKKEENGTKS